MSAAAPHTDDRPPDTTDVLDDPSAGGRAIRGAGVRVAGFVVGSLITLASAPLLVRHLGEVEFGRYATVLALTALVAGVTDAGLGAIALQEYSVRTGADRDRFMRSVLGARMALTTAGVLVATAFAAVAGYGGDLVLGTLAAGAGLLIAVVAGTIAMPLTAGLRLGWVTLVDLLAKAVTVGLVVALVLASADVVAFLAVGIPGGLLYLALTAVLVRGQVPMWPSTHVGELASLIRGTLPLAVATVLATFYARIVIIIMSLIATQEATGAFGIASRLTEIAIAIPLTLVATTFPILARAARDDHERLRYVLQRIFEVALVLGVWMALTTAVGAEVLIAIVGGTEAAGARAPLTILAFALIPVFLNATWQHGLLALRRFRELLITNACGLALITALTFLLVPPLGARGAAYSVVAGETVLAIVSGILLVAHHPRLRPELGVVWRVGVAAAVAVGVAYATGGLADVLTVLLSTSAYVLVALALGAVPRELRDAVASRLRPAGQRSPGAG